MRVLLLPVLLLLLPVIARGQSLDVESRSFSEINAMYKKAFEEEPNRKDEKLIKRSLHHWRQHLNDKGEMFNYTWANKQVVDALTLDTLEGTLQGEWQSIGPVNVVGTNLHDAEGMGRVNCIAFADATTWYAGTAGGGLWRTDIAGLYLGGDTYPWYPLTDHLPTLGISGIEVHPSDPDDVFILTGDGESRRYRDRGNQPGIGILHSTDGGVTWDSTSLIYGATALEAGFKLVRQPGSIDTMFAACTDSLFRTTDGWQSHTSVISTRCYDVEFKPGDPQVVYAACKESLRRSTDGGVTFTDITNNLVQTNLSPDTLMGRMELAVSADDPNYLYVVIANANNGGLLTFQYSTDGGNTFVETTDNDFNLLASRDPVEQSGGQGNYDLAIWADPDNASTVMVGGIDIWKSVALGALWFKSADWEDDPPDYVHADIHDIVTNPFNGDVVTLTDGGIYSSSNGGQDWFNRSKGLGITQYYHIDVYTEFIGLPFVGGGTQDNGTSVGIGFIDNVFQFIQGGDGFRYYRGSYDSQPVRYGSIQNGKIFRQVYNDFFDFWDSEIITPDDQENDDGEGLGPWDTPYQPKASSFNELLAGYDKLYWFNGGWTSMDFPVGVSYGSSNEILELEWVPSNPSVAYFYTQDGTERDLYRVGNVYLGAILGQLDDASTTIFSLDSEPSMPSGDFSDIADIFIDPNNDTSVWITFYSYFGGQKVYYNQNMMADSPWVNLSYDLPNVPVHCGVWDVDGIYIGTDVGVFFLPHGESNWIYFSGGLPTVSVTELRIANTILGKMVFAGTWGRGIWYSTPAETPRRTRWYVDIDASGMNTGTSWVNAFTDLQVAMNTALPGDSIWVAEGTYLPGSASGFIIASSDVRVYGGFDATEDSISQRSILFNETILSGDIGVVDDSTDNAFHVISLTDQNAGVLIDGFTDRRGQCTRYDHRQLRRRNICQLQCWSHQAAHRQLQDQAQHCHTIWRRSVPWQLQLQWTSAEIPQLRDHK